MEKTIELYVLEHGMPQDATDMVIITNLWLNNGYDIGFGLENKNSTKCSSNGFCYYMSCDWHFCKIKAEYRKGKKKIYTLGAKKNFTNQGKWELTCMSTALGNKIDACGIFQGMGQLDCSQSYYDEDYEEYVSACDGW